MEEALYGAIGRGRTRAGRADNLCRVAAIAGRPAGQRESVFLVANDVAVHDGIAEIEHVALAEVATALIVVKARLLEVGPARSAPPQPLA